MSTGEPSPAGGRGVGIAAAGSWQLAVGSRQSAVGHEQPLVGAWRAAAAVPEAGIQRAELEFDQFRVGERPVNLLAA